MEEIKFFVTDKTESIVKKLKLNKFHQHQLNLEDGC